MSQVTKTVDISEGADYNHLEDVVIHELNERNIEIKDISEDRGKIKIIAEAPPSLLSWGEEIYIQISPNEIEVGSKTPGQILDWGKSKSNVENISSSIKQNIGQLA